MTGILDDDPKGNRPQQDFDVGLDVGQVPHQSWDESRQTLRELLASIDPEEVAEIRRKNSEQMDR